MMISGMLSYALDFSFSAENFRHWSKQINKHTGTAMCIAEETSSTLWLDIIARKGLSEEVTVKYNLSVEKEAPI